MAQGLAGKAAVAFAAAARPPRNMSVGHAEAFRDAEAFGGDGVPPEFQVRRVPEAENPL
jgi:hypothetical protein